MTMQPVEIPRDPPVWPFFAVLAFEIAVTALLLWVVW